MQLEQLLHVMRVTQLERLLHVMRVMVAPSHGESASRPPGSEVIAL